MLEYIIDNIYVAFGEQIFQQTVGVPIGTNCAPLLADLFLYGFEVEFIKWLLKSGKKHLAQKFNFTFRYTRSKKVLYTKFLVLPWQLRKISAIKTHAPF